MVSPSLEDANSSVVVPVPGRRKTALVEVAPKEKSLIWGRHPVQAIDVVANVTVEVALFERLLIEATARATWALLSKSTVPKNPPRRNKPE